MIPHANSPARPSLGSWEPYEGVGRGSFLAFAAGRIAAPLFFAFVTLLLFSSPEWSAACELRPGAPLAEPWRLLTGHFTHWTADHLRWDLLVFAALALLFPPRRLVSLLFWTALLVSAGVVIFLPEMPAYRGLSGLDSALFVALALDFGRRPKSVDRLLGALALLLFLAKIAAELASGQAIFAPGPFVPVPLAHLLGLAAAVIEAGLGHNARP